MTRKTPQIGTVAPIVRTASPVAVGAVVGDGSLITSVVGYAYCVICNTVLSSYCSTWARSGLQCPKCKHLTWYIKREWRGTPMVDESAFDITQYVKPRIDPTNSPRIQLSDSIVATTTNCAPEPEFQKSLLAKLTRIARALERLADAWEGGQDIKSGA